MKTKILFSGLLIVLISLIALTSCKKVEDKIEDEIIPELSATIDGQEWKTATVVAIKTDTSFVIEAKKDSTTLSFAVKTFKNGVFPIDGQNAFATYIYGSSMDFYIATEGEIEILEAEDHGGNFNMKFHFKAYNLSLDSVIVTNGTAKNIINPL